MMQFFAEPSGPMFLRIIDHCRQLFPMVANHRSSEAMFAMYRSSLHTSGVGKAHKWYRKDFLQSITRMRRKWFRKDWVLRKNACVWAPVANDSQQWVPKIISHHRLFWDMNHKNLSHHCYTLKGMKAFIYWSLELESVLTAAKPCLWVILRCWGNSSILCQQNSDAL